MEDAQRSKTPYLEKVPTWALENRKRFLSIAQTERGPAVHKEVSRPTTQKEVPCSGDVTRAASMGLLVESPPPTGPKPADYFRDVKNHPDVLSTILETARIHVGYAPGIVRDKTAALKQHEAFVRFITEMDNYLYYVGMIGHNSTPVVNEKGGCDVLVSNIVACVENPLGGLDEAMKEKLLNMVKTVVEVSVVGKKNLNVGEKTEAYTTSFELLALPAAAKAPLGDPACAICLSVVSMALVNGEATVVSKTFVVETYIFRLKSNTIIEYAEDLSGTIITDASQLANIFNSER